MGKTKRQLLNEIDAHELAEWRALMQVEPFGDYRADLRSATIACTMANIGRSKKQKLFKLSDFMLQFEPQKKQSIDEMRNVLMGLG